MVKLYRAMTEEYGKPKTGRTARLLGIRTEGTSTDVKIEEVLEGNLDQQGYLLDEEAKRQNVGNPVKVVVKDSGGMSTFSTISGIPPSRKPKEFGGRGNDPLWEIDDSKITGDLEAVEDGENGSSHVSIQPKKTMLLEKYEQALANTQNDWKRVP